VSAPTRSFARASALLIAIALGTLAGASAAQAAPAPTITATCSTLSIALDGYPVGANSIDIVVDGSAPVTIPFSETLIAEFVFLDPTVAHSWAVTIHFVGSSYDPTFEDATAPCEAPPEPLPAATAALSTIPAGCNGHPEQLVLGDLANASWGAASRMIGPGDYSVTATADPGHLFADGTSHLLFTGTLAAEQVTPACVPPPAAPPITPQLASVAVIPAPAALEVQELAQAGPEALPATTAALLLLLGGAFLIGKGRRPAEQV